MFSCVGKTSSLLAAVEQNLWVDNDCQKIVSSNVSTRPCLPKKKHRTATACVSNDDPRRFLSCFPDDNDEIRIWFKFDNLSNSSYRWKSLFCRMKINNKPDEDINWWLETSRKIDRSLICRQHTERNNSMRYWESSEKKNERTVLNRTDRLWLF